MYLKHLVFRENDFSKMVQFRSECSALIYCACLFLFITLTTVSTRTYSINSDFHFTVLMAKSLVIMGSLLELSILKDNSLYAFRYLVGSGATTLWDKINFVVRFNGFANFIVLFFTIFNFCFFWLLKPLDGVFNKTLQNTQATTVYGFHLELEKVFSNYLPELICTQLFFLFLAVGVFALYSKHKFENSRIIFSVDFDRSGQQSEYSVSKNGVSLVLKEGESKPLDLSADKLRFARDSVIVIGRSGSAIYERSALRKIIVKGNKIDAEIKFNDSLGQWVCNSLVGA